jgi:hypothetical protein
MPANSSLETPIGAPRLRCRSPRDGDCRPLDRSSGINPTELSFLTLFRLDRRTQWSIAGPHGICAKAV